MRQHLFRIVSAFLLGLSSLSASAEQADAPAAAVCEHRLNVSVGPADLTENHTLPLQALNELGQPVGTRAPTTMVGATTQRPFADVQVEVGQDGCLNASVKADYTNLTVYVAKEFSPGSCAYDHIYEHELHHVKIYRQHAEQLREALPKELSQMLRDSTDAPDVLREKMRNHVFKRLGDVAERHASFDSPEEYDKNRWKCRGVIARAVRGISSF